MYGQTLVDTWVDFDRCMDRLLQTNGLTLVDEWVDFDRCMDTLGQTNGWTLVDEWVDFGRYMGRLWQMYGSSGRCMGLLVDVWVHVYTLQTDYIATANIFQKKDTIIVAVQK